MRFLVHLRGVPRALRAQVDAIVPLRVKKGKDGLGYDGLAYADRLGCGHYGRKRRDSNPRPPA